MSRREQYGQQITCGTCQATGTAKFDEFENPVFSGGKLDTRIVSVSDEFEVMAGQVVCKNCGSKVQAPN